MTTMKSSNRFGISPDTRHSDMRSIGGRLSVPCPEGTGHDKAKVSQKGVEEEEESVRQEKELLLNTLKITEQHSSGCEDTESLFKQEYLNKIRTFSSSLGSNKIENDKLKETKDSSIQPKATTSKINRTKSLNYGGSNGSSKLPQRTKQEPKPNNTSKPETPETDKVVKSVPHNEKSEKFKKDEDSNGNHRAQSSQSKTETKLSLGSLETTENITEYYSRLTSLESEIALESIESVKTHSTAASRVRFTMPSMEFVWESDPNGGKKVTFLVGEDGEPSVVVLGTPHVDSILMERARTQTEREEHLIKSAAEEELDRLVRLSRSTVQQMEEDATNRNKRESNPARAAVMSSLQEIEVELQIRELQEREQTTTIRTDTTSKVSNGDSNGVSPPTPPPSPPATSANPTNDLSNNKTANSITTKTTTSTVNSKLSVPISSNDPIKTVNGSTTVSNGTNSSKVHAIKNGKFSDPSSTTSSAGPPNFIIQPYGEQTSPIKKIQTRVWEPSPRKQVITTTTTKPLTAQTSSNGDSSRGLNGKPSASILNQKSQVYNFTERIAKDKDSTSDKSKECAKISKPIPTRDSNSLTSRSFATSVFNKSSKITNANNSSPTYIAEEQPSPPPPLDNDPDTENPTKATVSLLSGVSDQIKRFESLSEGSLEALRTATLERARKKRQAEILEHLRQQVELAKQQAEKVDRAWQEQERKAKQAEARIREIARRARQEHRRITNSFSIKNTEEEQPADERPTDSTGHTYVNSSVNSNTIKPAATSDINGNVTSAVNSDTVEPLVPSSCAPRKLKPVKPPTREAIISWFREEELAKGAGLDDTRKAIAPWFHGIISRQDAEQLLQNSSVGSFLVRVSERIWGYAISYRASDRCRHYLIDVTSGRYTFLGSQQPPHQTLGGLVEFHRSEPITAAGGEILITPCGQTDAFKPDYFSLFSGTEFIITGPSGGK